MIVKVNGKICAMGKVIGLTWVVIHLIKRLAVRSNQEIAAVWEAIKSMLSDLC